MSEISSSSGDKNASEILQERTKLQEWGVFLFLTVILAPVIAVVVVFGYGFIIWILQLIAGPPGPPPV